MSDVLAGGWARPRAVPGPPRRRGQLLLVLATGAVLGSGLTAAVDREAPPVAAPSGHRVAAAWVAAFDAPVPGTLRERAALARRIGGLYAVDGTAHDVATETSTYGRAAITARWHRLLALDYVSLRIDEVVVGGDGFTVRWQRRAGESFFGKCSFSTAGVTVFQVRNGKIAASYDYFDPREVLCGPPRSAPGA